MKKILSLALAVMMLVSAVPMVYAAETTDVSNGTTITATGTKGAAYSVTVPAVLTPGQSGTVTASGTWAANQTLKVTAPTSVDLVNGSDKIPVGIEFAGIEEIGNNNGDAEYATATVTVGTVDTSAFFGTWTGTLNYTVEMVEEVAHPLKFGEKYVCTTDNYGGSTLGQYTIYYADGSGESDVGGVLSTQQAGHYTYAGTEIRFGDMMGSEQRIVSADGTTITYMFEGEITHIFTLES